MKNRLRGAQNQYNNGDPVGHFRVFNKLAISPLNLRLTTIKGVSQNEFEICVRQRLVQQLMTNGFLGELTLHCGFPNYQISAPLPMAWRKSLGCNKLSIVNLTSSLRWCFCVLHGFLVGMRRFIRLVSYTTKKFDVNTREESELVLPGLSACNMPSNESVFGNRNDFVHWVIKREVNYPNLKIIAHLPNSIPAKIGPNLYRVPEIFHPIASWMDFLLFFYESTLFIEAKNI
jgi:hypothetical protein